jgi:hypothetical protein
MNKYMTPQLQQLRQAAAMKMQAAAPAAIPSPTPAEAPGEPAKTKTSWKDYILPAVAGAGSLGAGIADAMAEGDEGGGGGNIPSGSSPVGINAPSVGQPFGSGRMNLSPQQRSSLALAMLGKMV